MKALMTLMLMAAAPLAALAAPEWKTVNNMSLRYEVTGNGPDIVVLLQESSKPLEIWDEILPALQAPGRTILRYDTRGSGLSEKFRHPTTMQDQVDDLRELLNALDLRAPVVMLSGAFGGSIAMQFAVQYPDRVRGIVVTSPSAVLDPAPPRSRVNPATDPAGAREAAERALRVTYPEEFRSNEARWQKYLGMHSQNDYDSEILIEALINTTPFRDVLPRIQCPTLLVATTRFVRPVSAVQELASLIPQGRFLALETGHVAAFMSPELVAPVFLGFMRELGL